ncbi:GTPase IMAP family member 6-like [Osmerus eperlanus]|uniref:GTPase IMAP family member 6-like n=1 Tax=Osmerus eperlanus TaxID=29151 RepID=UPI002E0F40C1
MAFSKVESHIKLVTGDIVQTNSGNELTLPCFLDPKINANFVTIKWFKESECIYLYRSGFVTEAVGYEHKVSVLPEELERGNVSLRLRNVTSSDRGVYICQVISQGQMLEVAVWLWVSNAKAYLQSETLINKRRRIESANMLETKKPHHLIIKEPRQLDKLQEEKDNLKQDIPRKRAVTEPIQHLMNRTMEDINQAPAQRRITISSCMEAESVSELRVVLLGRTGAGRKAAGNLLLGREECEAQDSPAEVTHSGRRERDVCGRRLVLVDTPDWFCPDLSLEERRRDVGRCVRLSAPGPHAFLLVVPVEPPEGEERRAVEVMEEMFGEGCWGHSIILFTHAGSLREQKMDARSQNMQMLIEKCMNSYCILNIEDRTRGTQVSKLLNQIEEIVAGNRESFYSSQMYQEAQAKRMAMENVCRERGENAEGSEKKERHI